MSINISDDVWENSTATGGGRLVMLCLADMCNDGGVCWPSIATISTRTKLSERQVQYLIRSLVSTGELFVQDGGGRHHSSTYHVTVQRAQRVQSVQETVQFAAERVQSTTERVKPIAPQPSEEPSLEPSVEPGKRKLVTEDFIIEMVEKYGERLGGEQAIRDQIGEAMNHRAYDGWKDKRKGVDDWLRRNTERNPRRAAPAQPALDIYEQEEQRLAALRRTY